MKITKTTKPEFVKEAVRDIEERVKRVKVMIDDIDKRLCLKEAAHATGKDRLQTGH